MSETAVITCSLTGVLTDPKEHPVPVTVKEMAASAKQAYDAGATCMHVHFRQQAEGQGHLPCWDPEVVVEIDVAIRESCPDVIMNYTTGTITRDQSGPINILRAGKPEIAACNAGSLNYLKTRSNGSWAWKPIMFENPVDKVEELLGVMKETTTRPEFECFDVGIVRSVGMYKDVGMVDKLDYNLVMGVASGMPVDGNLLKIVLGYLKPDSQWQSTLIGRKEIWPVHQLTAESGGHLRTGLEDTFYLPSGERAKSNGELIDALVQVAENTGRSIASTEEAREIFL